MSLELTTCDLNWPPLNLTAHTFRYAGSTTIGPNSCYSHHWTWPNSCLRQVCLSVVSKKNYTFAQCVVCVYVPKSVQCFCVLYYMYCVLLLPYVPLWFCRRTISFSCLYDNMTIQMTVQDDLTWFDWVGGHGKMYTQKRAVSDLNIW